jgi:hypothetical protein
LLLTPRKREHPEKWCCERVAVMCVFVRVFVLGTVARRRLVDLQRKLPAVAHTGGTRDNMHTLIHTHSGVHVDVVAGVRVRPVSHPLMTGLGLCRAWVRTAACCTNPTHTHTIKAVQLGLCWWEQGMCCLWLMLSAWQCHSHRTVTRQACEPPQQPSTHMRGQDRQRMFSLLSICRTCILAECCVGLCVLA